MPTKALLKMCVVILLDMIVAIGVAFATMPFYLKSFGVSASAMGIAVMLFSGAQFLMNPVWGALSDRLGRKPLLIVQQAGAAIGMIIIFFAKSVPYIYAGRAVGGLFAGCLMLSTAYVSDITPPEKRTQAVGALAASLVVGGFMIGPALAGALSKIALRVPFGFAAGLALVNALYIFLFVEEPKVHKVTERPKIDKASFARALESPRSRGAILLNAFAYCGVAAFQTCFPFFMSARFQLRSEQVGPILAILGVTGIIAQGVVVGWLSRKIGEQRVVMIAAFCQCIAVMIIATSPTFAPVIGAFILFGFCQGMLLPSLMSLASLGAPPELRGTVMGLYFGAQSLVLVFAPPLHGWLYDKVGVAAPFFLASALFGTVAVTGFLWKWGPRLASTLPTENA